MGDEQGEIIPPDLILRVEPDGADGLLHLIAERPDLQAEDLGPFADQDTIDNFLRTTLVQHVQTVLDDTGAEEYEQRLDQWGRQLWALFPERFRNDFYWNEIHEGQIGSILVVSRSLFPFLEIVLPADRDGQPAGTTTADLLGRRFSIVNWTCAATGLAGNFTATDGMVFVGPNLIDSVQNDCTVETFLGRERRRRGTPSQFLELFGMGFTAPRVVNVHAHGDPEFIRLHHNDGHLCVPGGNLDFCWQNLLRSDIEGFGFRFQKPTLVFFHCCRTGDDPGDSPTSWSVDGWAGLMTCELGCQIFIAPPWDVGQAVGVEVAEAFYPLLSDMTAGEALAWARANASHPSSALYRMHSFGDARIDLSLSGMGTAPAICGPTPLSPP